MQTERFLSQEDAVTLSRLAENLLRVRDVKFNFAEKLIELLSASILLPENAQRIDCVKLQSKVTYRVIGSDQCHSILIVCPNDANDLLAQVSILTPLALALIGRPVGSIVEIPMPFGQVRFVEITDVQLTAGPLAAGMVGHPAPFVAGIA